jgi:iron-sulfur cluster assembly accessory protein
MTLPVETETKTLELTQSAADAVREVMSQKNLQGYALRLFVSGGGCSGYQYGLALDNRFRPEDLVVETDGIKLIIDEVSIQYLHGSTVDYVNDGEENGFKIINPNPISACSCGQDTSAQGDSEGGCAGCG